MNKKYANTAKMLGADSKTASLFGDAVFNLVKCSSAEIQKESLDTIRPLFDRLKGVKDFTIEVIDLLLQNMITAHAHRGELPLKGKYIISPKPYILANTNEDSMEIRKRKPLFETDNFQDIFTTDSYNVHIKPEFELALQNALFKPWAKDVQLEKVNQDNGLTTIIAVYHGHVGSLLLARVKTETIIDVNDKKVTTPKISDELTNIAKMTINGNRLELPQNGKFDNYIQIKSILETAGGKYSKNGFTFTKDAQKVYDRLIGGEKVNDKKKFQFFATGDKLAKQAIAAANLFMDDYVLEPSAGQAGIAKHIPAFVKLDVVEFMEENREFLKKEGYNVIGDDFLKLEGEGVYDKIIANPPFSNNQDIKHLKHMFKLLKSGGRVVCIMSRSWQTGNTKMQKEFRTWLKELKAQITDIPEGEFKESGTNVATCLVSFNKP